MKFSTRILALSEIVEQIRRINYRRSFFGEWELGMKMYNNLIVALIKAQNEVNEKGLFDLCNTYGYDFILTLDNPPKMFVKENHEKFNWNNVAKTLPLSKKTLTHFGNYLNWNDIVLFQDFDMDIIQTHKEKIYFKLLLTRLEKEKLFQKDMKLNMSKNEYLTFYNYVLSKI